jgi:cell wall-associated NlpC family hydrolase
VTSLDRRLNAFRPDLADERLRGQVESARFVAGRPARALAPVVDLRAAPRPDAGQLAQLLMGDDVLVFEEAEGWAWVQAMRDGYVGYASAAMLGEPADAPTHVVAAPRTFVYPGPDLKLPRAAELSIGCRVTVVDHAEVRGTRYSVLPSGAVVVAAHLAEVDAAVPDYVAVAETLVRTPYLWGGNSGFGIDCSGLVQLSMRMAGRQVLRDSDMQAETVGEPLDPSARLQRGDLMFWKGHVAIVADPATLLHASGHVMQVIAEPLQPAVERIAKVYGGAIGLRRP